ADRGVASITWYYSARPDGQDRRRVVTYFHDTFDGEYGENWVPVNAVRPDWSIYREPGRAPRHILRGRTGGDPLVSLDPFTDSFVASTRLRPRPGARDFGVAVRANRETPGYYALRGTAELLNPEAPGVCATKPVRDVDADRWYWYELGIRSRSRDREIVVR